MFDITSNETRLDFLHIPTKFCQPLGNPKTEHKVDANLSSILRSRWRPFLDSPTRDVFPMPEYPEMRITSMDSLSTTRL
jgi:hypothetical protein